MGMLMSPISDAFLHLSILRLFLVKDKLVNYIKLYPFRIYSSYILGMVLALILRQMQNNFKN